MAFLLFSIIDFFDRERALALGRIRPVAVVLAVNEPAGVVERLAGTAAVVVGLTAGGARSWCEPRHLSSFRRLARQLGQGGALVLERAHQFFRRHGATGSLELDEAHALEKHGIRLRVGASDRSPFLDTAVAEVERERAVLLGDTAPVAAAIRAVDRDENGASDRDPPLGLARATVR